LILGHAPTIAPASTSGCNDSADRIAATTDFCLRFSSGAAPPRSFPTHIWAAIVARPNRRQFPSRPEFLMPAVAERPAPAVPVNPALLDAAVAAAEAAFTMCGMTARCVGAAKVPVREQGSVTGLIGVHGKVSGFITLNMSEHVAIRAVGGLLQESFEKLNAQVVDGTGEITNIVVGGIKSSLAHTDWAFSQITVPSVIVGSGYSIAYARGLEFVNVTFEHDDKEAVLLEDRLIQISMSLLTL
jgi:chemotaxis protein CheX